MRPAGFRARLFVCAAAAVMAATPAGSSAGEAADAMRDAGRMLADGDVDAAIAGLDAAVAAFWAALPLHVRVATFVAPGSVTAFSQYRPADATFRVGDVMSVYLEPVGYGLLPAGANQAVDIGAGLTIRSPGGIVYAKAADFARFGWKGRTGTREFHGTLSVEVPQLKPGAYELAIDLRDAATGKAASVTLPFTVAE